MCGVVGSAGADAAVLRGVRVPHAKDRAAGPCGARTTRLREERLYASRQFDWIDGKIKPCLISNSV